MTAARPRVLVTGAVGFVGSQLCRALARELPTIGGLRREEDIGKLPPGVEARVLGDIASATDFHEQMRDVDVVVHLAARVHVLEDHAKDPLAAFRATNVDGTLRLAQAAADKGMSHFVFVSTIGVNGGTSGDRAFSEADPPQPHTHYARSKLEAEIGLAKISAATGMKVTTFRPPLVYGPAVPGNFGRLIDAVRKGMPLPLGSIRNERSLVFVGNLVDAIINVLRNEPESSEIFFVADADAVSTPELVRKIAQRLNLPARMFPMPVFALRLGGHLTGRARQVEQVASSLKVSTEKIQRTRGWRPPYSLDEGLTLSLHEFTMNGMAR